jgi:hypothetical protein
MQQANGLPSSLPALASTAVDMMNKAAIRAASSLRSAPSQWIDWINQSDQLPTQNCAASAAAKNVPGRFECTELTIKAVVARFTVVSARNWLGKRGILIRE